MKICINTDLEGITGIDKMEMIQKDSPEYKYSVERLAADINAAIDGAFAGGATYVTVLDNHGGGNNLDPSLLDRRAEYDVKENGKWWGKLDNTFDGMFCIGCHAMAGTINGFLDHTMSSKSVFNYWVNGRKFGELGIFAMVAGHFDVPVIMVSGDEAACIEARQFLQPVECAIVKRGVGRNRAELVDNDIALELIREAARKSMSLIGKAKPFKPILPMEIKLELYRSDYCDIHAGKPGVERLDARTLRKISNSYLDYWI